MPDNQITIALDVMSSQGGPADFIAAIKSFHQKDVHFVLCGDVSTITQSLYEHKLPIERFTILHATDVVANEDPPVYALKNRKNSSMRVAVDALANNEVDAVVSCGNTGALMVIAKMVLGMLGDIKRPAICSLVPGLQHPFVMLDMGANAECDPVNFLQFAMMGHCFAKAILHLEQPKVAILNVGVEEHKGRELEKKSAALLVNSGLNYYGFVEPNHAIGSEIDVLVTDGFTGNIMIKSAEGTVKIYKQLLKNALSAGWWQKFVGYLVRPLLKKAIAKLDPTTNNGAMLIGLNGIVVKSHGDSDSAAITAAINKAYDLARYDINAKLASMLQPKPLIDRIKSSLGW